MNKTLLASYLYLGVFFIICVHFFHRCQCFPIRFHVVWLLDMYFTCNRRAEVMIKLHLTHRFWFFPSLPYHDDEVCVFNLPSLPYEWEFMVQCIFCFVAPMGDFMQAMRSALFLTLGVLVGEWYAAVITIPINVLALICKQIHLNPFVL